MSPGSRPGFRVATIAGVLLVLGLSALTGFPSTAASSQPAPIILFADGKLSLTAGAVSVTELIAEIHRATGIPIIADVSVEGELARAVITISLSGVSLETALQRIVGSTQLVLLYSGTALEEVRLYQAGGAPALGTADPARRSSPGHNEPTRVKKGSPPSVGTEALPAKPKRATRPDPIPASGGEPEPGVIADAAEVLGRSQDRRLLEQALATLAEGRDVPSDAILRFAESSHDPDLKGEALEVLAAQHGRHPRVLDLLRALAAGDPDEDVRDRARALLSGVTR